MIDNILDQLYRTSESAGIKILSDDHCCRLLAWLLIYGGGNEQVVLDVKLGTDIFEAQRRLNLCGGEIPNPELLPKLQRYIKSASEYNDPPKWIKELENKYTQHIVKKTKCNNITCKDDVLLFIHYTYCGIFEIDLDRIYSQNSNMQDFAIAKPAGLWVSMEHDNGWEKWCLDNDFHTEKLIRQFEIELKGTANILFINNDNDFNEFEKKYCKNDWTENNLKPIKWPMVIKDYQGIIITKYFGERRLSSFWYNGWGGVGGCIWDLRAVKRARIIK